MTGRAASFSAPHLGAVLRHVRHVGEPLVPGLTDPDVGVVAAEEDFDEVEVERRHDQTHAVRTTLADQRARRGALPRRTDDVQDDPGPPLLVVLHPEERRVERDLRDVDLGRVLIERVEPGLTPVGA